MSARLHPIAAGVLAALAAQASLAAPAAAPAAPPQAAADASPDAAARALLEQGRYWYARANRVRAAEAFGRLLQLDPRHPDALYHLGLLELDAQRTAKARGYQAELAALGTAPVLAARLDQDIALREGTRPKDLEKARLLAESGDLDGAVAQYRALFGGKAPQGKVGFEYYAYLGYTASGWNEAREGLERLHRESPEDVNVALVLAKHLIRNETTRAEGVRRLAALSTRADIGGDATESWRLALTWFGTPRPAEAPLFEAYLKAHPDDAEIREQYARMRSAPAAGARSAGDARRDDGAAGARPAAPSQESATAVGFKALDAGDLASAEARFQARLKEKANDSDALAGMGVLRLRQDRPEEAEDFLARAVRQPGARAGWKQVLTTAQYWSLNTRAEQARAGGDGARARQLLQQAIALNTGDRTADLALARVQADAGDFKGAEKGYRAVLAREPDNGLAVEGLINVLAQTDRADEALRLVDTLPAASQQRLGGVGQLRATQARSAAKAALARGDDAGARQLLEDGLRYAPNEPWLRLELSRLYLKTGATREARGLVDGLLLTHPDDPGALQASALLAAETQDWSAALQALDRIAPANRTREVLDLQRRAWVHEQAAQARALAAAGNAAQARALLAQAEPEAGQQAELLGAVATAWVDAGDPNRALGLLRQSLSRSPVADDAMLLQYATLLLRTDQDAEASGILRQLQQQALDETTRRGFEDLRKLYTVRQAEALRQRNRLADGYDVLAPMLLQYPDDPLVLGTLARMYASAGEGAKAVDLYKGLLQRDPDNAELWLAASQTALQAKDADYAQTALDTALRLRPQDANVLAAAARHYRAQGKSGKAADYMKLAIAAQQAAGGASLPGIAAATPAVVKDDNPFARLPGQTRSAVAAPALPPASLPVAGAPVPYASSPVFGAGAPVLVSPNAPSRYAGAGPASPAAVIPPARLPATPLPAPVETTPPAPRTPAAPRSAERSAVPPVTTVAYFGTPAATTATDYLDVPYAVAANAPRIADDIPVAVGPASQYSPAQNARARAAAAPAASGARSLEQELDEIQQQRSATITAGTVVRQHNGARGLSRMVDVETPVTVQFPVGDNKAFVQVTPVRVDAGAVGATLADGGQFGGGPSATASQQAGALGPAGTQRDTGVGVAVGYMLPGIKLDVGSTPFGFRYRNIVGGARFEGGTGGDDGGPRFTYGLDVSRRAVTDSVLSFAGARDARTGESWGAVTRTGGTLSLGVHFADYGFYGSLGGHGLTGHNVQSNSSIEGGLGTYVHLLRDSNRQLTAGLNLTSFAYDKNLSHYTYGQGGYFSPQRFVAASVPVSWAQRQGRLSYLVKGSVGVQHIKQDASDYYEDEARQAQADAVMAEANGGRARFAGESKTGIGYGLAAAAEYQVAQQWFVGANLGVDNARDYRQLVGGLYLRYALEPQTGPLGLPVMPVGSPYATE